MMTLDKHWKVNVKLIFFQGQVEADIEALGFDRYAIYRPGWVILFA